MVGEKTIAMVTWRESIVTVTTVNANMDMENMGNMALAGVDICTRNEILLTDILYFIYFLIVICVLIFSKMYINN